ncbi:MAG: DMT family transporter [Hyphomicrobiaceae bacterium]
MAVQSPPSHAEEAQATYLGGIMLLVAGTIAFSSAGLFVRLIGHDAATLLFWRGIFTAIAVLGFIWWREGARGTREQFLNMGWPGLAVASLSTLSMAFFIASLQYTTVANNSIIFGTGPFLTAGFAWLMIRERPSAATLFFTVMALVGAFLVVGSSFTLTGAHLVGDALAVLMTVSFAVKTVLVRQYRSRPMVPAGCVGAVLGTLGAIPFGPTLSLSWSELGLFALFGFTQQGAGLILTTLGIGRVPAAHAALIMSLDVPMSPMWVWMVFGEGPTRLGLIGGAIVLGAIVGHILIEGRRQGDARQAAKRAGVAAKVAD